MTISKLIKQISWENYLNNSVSVKELTEKELIISDAIRILRIH